VVVWLVAMMPIQVMAQTGTSSTAAGPEAVKRGAYLVAFGGCHDCHTPLKLGPNGPAPDMTRALSGHQAGLIMPPAPKAEGPWLWHGAATMTAFAGPWGVSYSINLTPDPTGLGEWTETMFVQAMRTGKHAGVGRPILPPMPWQSLNALSDTDLKAVFAYLRTVTPVKNMVPPAVLAPPAPKAAGGH
jgi:hypothetical protein